MAGEPQGDTKLVFWPTLFLIFLALFEKRDEADKVARGPDLMLREGLPSGVDREAEP